MKNTTLEQFTLKTASKEPTPGGGGVSGLVGSLASSLAMMVCNLTIGKPKYISYTSELESIKKEAEILRSNLLDCIDKDAEAFLPLSKAYSMGKSIPGYKDNLEKCLKEAANSPYLILKYCARIVDLDERLAKIGSKLSVSDAGTSVMLAYGALYGAFINIKVNTRLMSDREYANNLDSEALEILNEYSKKAQDVYNEVLMRLS